MHIWQSATTTDGVVSFGEFLVGFEQSLMAAGVDYLPLGLYACWRVYLWVIGHNGNRQRSYQRKYTSSRPITEVKCVRAQIVLGWGTAWEHWVTLASLNFLLPLLPCPGGRRQQDGWVGDTYARIFVLRLVVLLPRRG